MAAFLLALGLVAALPGPRHLGAGGDVRSPLLLGQGVFGQKRPQRPKKAEPTKPAMELGAGPESSKVTRVKQES